MSEPLICCICPCPKRNAIFIDRAGRAWASQGFSNSRFFLVDTSTPEFAGKTVGSIRNSILEKTGNADYVAHFDWDDISAPDRLSHQLAHIQKTGKLVTGYYNMPMYDVKNDKVWIYTDPLKRYILGTSLFYKREAWERVKFPDRTPEDNLWRKQVGGENCEPQSVFREDGTPMMVQTVHGGNASARIVPNSKRFREPNEAEEKAIRELLRA